MNLLRLFLLAIACRKAETGRIFFLSEVLIPFGRNGHVPLCGVGNEATVTILAVRLPPEED